MKIVFDKKEKREYREFFQELQANFPEYIPEELVNTDYLKAEVKGFTNALITVECTEEKLEVTLSSEYVLDSVGVYTEMIPIIKGVIGGLKVAVLAIKGIVKPFIDKWVELIAESEEKDD